MKARDIFGIILRTLALWITVWGAWQTMAALAQLPATVSSIFSQQPISGINSLVYFAYGLPAVIGGILVLWFADALVALTYRRRD